MRDLANERAEVVQRLKELNLEPLAAETMTPTGAESWDRLKAAIEECDLFVLILGETYGWIPDSGPMAQMGKSVTHLEFEHARSIGLDILVFVKKLGQDPRPTTADTRRRDEFKSSVEQWDGGLFRGQFELARDLADQVGQAAAGLISDRFRTARLLERRAAKRPAREPEPIPPERVLLPEGLVEATAKGQVVLLLGAGASLEAGMPGAAMFIEAMAAEIKRLIPGYEPGVSGTTFNAVATDYESLRGDTALQKLARGLIEPGFAVPTDAHRIAGRLFDTIITTNYDRLLERAISGTDREFVVIDGEGTPAELSERLKVVKLHGSVDRPENLVMTEPQLANLEQDRSRLWRHLVQLLQSRPVLVVGSSLRDPSIIRLLEESRPAIRGWAVQPNPTEMERLRLQRWNLDVIAGDANGSLAALEKLVAGLRV
jgi:hypothetical protein